MLNSNQSFTYRLVVNGDYELDVFKDEELFLNDNITQLFDIGTLPSDFTKTILLPGTKRNNAFFEHVYDISVTNPYLFQTNIKVDAYFDFEGIIPIQGYLQLNKVNLYENKFIESYEVNIYGLLSSFARDINRFFLNDLTSLTQYNHTSSVENITGSWEDNLFGGVIKYPLVDYGHKIEYTGLQQQQGINHKSGALSVQDFKPMIKQETVWDAIFTKTGFTYSSSFIENGGFDNSYLLLDRGKRYPVYNGVELEQFGVVRLAPESGSAGVDKVVAEDTTTVLPWEIVRDDPELSFEPTSAYKLPRRSNLSGRINLTVSITGSTVPNRTADTPRVETKLLLLDTGSTTVYGTSVLDDLNKYVDGVLSTANQVGDQEYSTLEKFSFQDVPAGTYRFGIRYTIPDTPTVQYTVAPDNNTDVYIQIDKVKQAADFRVLDIPSNMPYGTSGVTLADYIKGIQKKYNLIMYPSKTKQKEFIIEPYNDWIKQYSVKEWDNFVDLSQRMEVIPANNLAYREIQFGDTLDVDYLAKEFQNLNNREFSKIYYKDTENFFSQGEYKVETTFGVSPLAYVQGTGLSGSLTFRQGYQVTLRMTTSFTDPTNVCTSDNYETVTVYIERNASTIQQGDILYIDEFLTNPLVSYSYGRNTAETTIFEIDTFTGEVLPLIGTCDFID